MPSINLSQPHQDKNSWEHQESNPVLLGEMQVCYLCAMQPHPPKFPVVALIAAYCPTDGVAKISDTIFSYHLIPRPGIKLTSAELHFLERHKFKMLLVTELPRQRQRSTKISEKASPGFSNPGRVDFH